MRDRAERMKIAFISLSKIPSDTANSIQVMKVCQAFAQIGHDVILLVPGPKAKDLTQDKLQEHYGLKTLFKIDWLQLWNRNLFTFMAAFRARRLGADLLYTWPIQSAVIGSVLGLPTMLELHDTPKGRLGPSWLRSFLTLPGKKRLLPITNALSKTLELPDSQTVLAPDGVDLERYTALPDPVKARAQLALPESLTVLCTGHLYPGRGVGMFLFLAGKFPTTSFIWVGGRPEDVSTWRQHAADLPNVIFTGFVPNERIPLYQSCADVLLMPYERTIATSSGGNTADICSPMKMFEYMAAGRAILTSDLPVLHEVLNDEIAIFCPPDEEGAWEKALAGLLSDENQRVGLGKRAQRAAQGFSWLERARRSLEEF
jgi:glycosyltransferase involved in cell wall biosynthesis